MKTVIWILTMLMAFALFMGSASAIYTFPSGFVNKGPTYAYGTSALNYTTVTDLRASDDIYAVHLMALTTNLNATTMTNGYASGTLGVAGKSALNRTDITQLISSTRADLNRTRMTQADISGRASFNRTETTQLSSSTRADFNRTRISQLDVQGLSALNRTDMTQASVSGLADFNRTKTDQLESSTRADFNRTRIVQVDVSGLSALNRTQITQAEISGALYANATTSARPIAQSVTAELNSNTPYTATDDKYLILVDASGSNVTVTLPAASTVTGRSYVVMGTKDPGSYYVRITATTGSLIRPRGVAAGSTYLVSTDASPEVTLTSDGTTYWARTTGTWAQHAA